MSKRSAHNRNLILRYLRMDADSYADMVYAEGVRYLSMYMADDPQGRAALEGLASYWKWWTVQWQRADAEFIIAADLLHAGPLADAWMRSKLHELYHVLHNGELRTDLRVCRRVMRNALEVMEHQYVER